MGDVKKESSAAGGGRVLMMLKLMFLPAFGAHGGEESCLNKEPRLYLTHPYTIGVKAQPKYEYFTAGFGLLKICVQFMKRLV